ncbi:response regulator transcription factor [Pseudodonghicola xiamenensis]|uniref:DNA-binding response regulator n=1 Tax=Pseudodonghicola xiamenensis TaxID=337702 RepID=A0A8J3HBP9_9RHOB|nr:response regulator [Pseudodonghicola xiamenensis]GHH00977.1 DNA-binding response regulator [Pseudodonghicola xiamenensis]
MTDQAVIHIVDDDRAAREGLGFLLSSLGLKTRAYASAAELLEAIDDQAEGCILADVRMPGMSGLELLDELGRRGCLLPVIMITGHGDVPMAVRAMRAGAVDFFEKPVNGMTLVDRIKEALDQSRARAGTEREKVRLIRRIDSLTTREAEVARAVLRGLMNKQIAHELGISQKTVENHRHNAMEKMGATSAADLVRLLVAAGWSEG